jgi:putative ABC transport system permease protein
MYIPLGVAVGMTVGLLSALYPAWRAANMDPINALNEQ